LGDDSNDGDNGLGLKNLCCIKKADYCVLLAHLFLTLTFQNWKKKVEKLITLVDAHNLKGVLQISGVIWSAGIPRRGTRYFLWMPMQLLLQISEDHGSFQHRNKFSHHAHHAL
jgi:hypothetical protein